MATDVKLPRLGQGMESGVIVRWLKSEGEPVAKGEPLYELDTDKVTQEVESELDGVLTKIVVPEGDVEVGATVAVIESDGASPAPADAQAEAPREAPAEDSPADAAEAPAPAPEPAPAAAPPGADGRTAAAPARLKASPLARRMARERGVDLASLQGTGPEGRILADDVERAASGAAAPAIPSTASPALPAKPCWSTPAALSAASTNPGLSGFGSRSTIRSRRSTASG